MYLVLRDQSYIVTWLLLAVLCTSQFTYKTTQPTSRGFTSWQHLVIDLLGAHFWHVLQDPQQDPTRSKALRGNGTIERYAWNSKLCREGRNQPPQHISWLYLITTHDSGNQLPFPHLTHSDQSAPRNTLYLSIISRELRGCVNIRISIYRRM